MSKIKKSRPWVEPGLYVECPYCGKSHLLESDHSVSESWIPYGDEAYEYTCEGCGEVFLVSGDED